MASGFLFAINVGIRLVKITPFMFMGELGKLEKSKWCVSSIVKFDKRCRLTAPFFDEIKNF
jgi:hypothetical protein